MPKSKKFSGNHQRGWLWGHHAVIETLMNGNWPVLEIFASAQAALQHATVLRSQESEGVPLEIVSSDRLEQLSRSSEHQGLVIRLGQFPYQSMETFSTVLADSIARDRQQVKAMPPVPPPLVVICDRIQDTFNFGAILRCCDGANVDGVIVGDRGQAEVTPHVARSSSGAVNHIPIVKVSDLLESARFIKQQGFRLAAADANANTSVWHAPLGGPIGLVIGSEATGISTDLQSICDQKLWIPMLGKVTSLNAAVATGILLYEIRRQQISAVE